jgi:hypothetical protein
MTRPVRPTALHRLLLGLVAVAVLLAVVPPAPAAAATDRLPDLRVASITDLRLVASGGRRLLRFTGMMWNNGTGPMEVRANRPSSASSAWAVDQIVYNSAGGFRRIRTTAGMQYAGDGHDHWHVRRMLTYHLWGATGTLRTSKIGFCFFDTNLLSPSLPGSPSHRVYTESMCGRRASTSTRNGISVGWGDKYPWNFALQWIDVTGLPAGTYTLRSAVDLYKAFTERSETNNCAWARIRIPASGSTVSVVDRGQTCVNDQSGSPYAADIAWAREAGISSGCDADMFCTNNPLTRGLTATFVARAFAYPAATLDYFTDDGNSAYEADINRIAEAGIAPRCAPGKYCPDKPMTRGLIAYVLDKALDLPEATQDYFDDDAGSNVEGSINRLAEAGITTGCGVRRYCPSSSVTRGQLMRLLHRSLVPAP